MGLHILEIFYGVMESLDCVDEHFCEEIVIIQVYVFYCVCLYIH